MTGPQSWIDEVDVDNAMEINAGIARWIRLTGTDDEREAFDYIDSVLSSYGLQTRIHESTCLVSLPVSASLAVEDEFFHCITHSFSTSTSEDGVAGQLVYAGAGEKEDLGSVNGAGKIVVTEGLATPQKAFAASEAGVLALINISGEHLHEMTVSPVWGSPTPDALAELPTVPVISVDSETGDRLKELLADDAAVRAKVATVVDTRWRPIPTLVADLGTGDREFILFSGHVDSWHYGAMDNGSANATMVEVARILANHKGELHRDIRFAFWSGHSHARYAGSTWFADAYWFDLRERCIAHVNVDSPGGVGATDLTSANMMAETYPFAKEVIERQTGQQLVYNRFGRAGDQSFWGIGLPAMFMSISQQGESSEVSDQLAQLVGSNVARRGGLGWWWHTTEDTLDKIDPANLERDIKIYVEVTGRLLTDPVPPFDVQAALQEISDEVTAAEALWDGLPAGGPDDDTTFSLLRADIDAGLAAAIAVQVKIDSDSLTEAEADQLSAAIVQACKYLIPVNYTSGGEFAHDSALGSSPLPGLKPVKSVVSMSDDELWAATHQLRRSVNRVRFGVRQATRVLEQAL